MGINGDGWAVAAGFYNVTTQCIADNYFFDAHFDSRATMLADNPKVDNLTTSDGFLIAD
jgi:hypothetical protein